MEVLHCQGTTDPLYQAVQEIRRDGSERVYHDFDEYSYHYVLHLHEKPLGTLTVQAACDGDLDCQSFYPRALVERHRERVIGTCKMRIRRGAESPMEALRTLIRSAWIDQIRRGTRVSIANSEPRLTAFYRRIGFTYVPGFDFVHPKLGTQSQVLVMAADPNHRSFCQDLFALLPDPVSQQATIHLCRRSNAIITELAGAA